MQGATPAMWLALAAGVLGVLAMGAMAPQAYISLLPLLGLAAVGIACWEFSSLVLAVLVALIAMSPEFHIDVEPGLVIALHKAAIIGIAVVIMVQRGISGQFNGPVFAFLAALALTIMFGTLHPWLTSGDMVRSLIGSLAPFVPIWVRSDRRWHGRYILIAAASPLLALAFAVPLQALGLHVIINNALRMQGAGIPAYLGYLGEIGTYAAFAEYAVTGRRKFLWLAVAAYCCILGSMTRVPLITALLFCVIVLTFARGANFDRARRRQLWLLGGGLFVAGALVVGPLLVARTVGSSPGDTELNLSGRDVIWPLFADAVSRFPLLGQGVGTAKVLVPIEHVQLIGSNAVHNEYLRLSVDMGVVGLLLFLLGHVAWFRGEWRHLTQVERVVVCAFGVSFALHSITDNTLITPQAMVLYFWLATFLQRARQRAATARGMRAPYGSPTYGPA